ncbi:MAG: hypothetical protein DHS20C15_06830 [Planctomycetota bacterium]|nr:MAG: hypothetical protein DHS20C15_06830 [Planctomycetota bacterium]
MKVRPATAADLEVLVEFNASLARETEGRELDLDRLRAGVRAQLSDPARGHYFLVERDGEALGGLACTREWSDWRNGWFWWIQSVYVRSTARRQGVYRALHDSVRAAAIAAGDVCGLRLYVERENHSAQRTYAAVGMQEAVYALWEEDFVLGG